MKDSFSLAIAKPCNENWDNFVPTPQGGFCNSCSKNVTDFTQMSDEEILRFFRDNAAHSCGRFRPSQLKAYSFTTATQTPSKGKFIRVGILGLFLLLINKQGMAINTYVKSTTEFVSLVNDTKVQNTSDDGLRKIKGTIKDELNKPLPGVAVSLKGAAVGTVTDAYGQFEFPQELRIGDILVVNYVGYETIEYGIRHNTPPIIEIKLTSDHLSLMGEVSVEKPYTSKTSGISGLWAKLKDLF